MKPITEAEKSQCVLSWTYIPVTNSCPTHIPIVLQHTKDAPNAKSIKKWYKNVQKNLMGT